MNRWMMLASVAALGTSVSYAQCNTRPSYSFNGQVKIEYPRSNAASVYQFCGPSATRLKQDILSQSRKLGLDVRWVEYYRVANWVSVFHDSIYQTRSMGFQQEKYKQFNVAGWHDMETLVYGNASGRYVGMISRTVPGMRNTSEFVLYGN
ncbi:hypothetical protein [Deinococcus altitudinis]|uniref:hypothetical protein n=1 Tax=Deinococcus altitudinis TaxID=468914 RepID=UPI003892BD89